MLQAWDFWGVACYNKIKENKGEVAVGELSCLNNEVLLARMQECLDEMALTDGEAFLRELYNFNRYHCEFFRRSGTDEQRKQLRHIADKKREIKSRFDTGLREAINGLDGSWNDCANEDKTECLDRYRQWIRLQNLCVRMDICEMDCLNLMATNEKAE
jgi:hypothetical protein